MQRYWKTNRSNDVFGVLKLPMSLLLSVSLAMGGAPTRALAEAADGLVVVQETQAQEGDAAVQTDAEADVLTLGAESAEPAQDQTQAQEQVQSQEQIQVQGQQEQGQGDKATTPESTDNKDLTVAQDKKNDDEKTPRADVKNSPSNYDAGLFDADGKYPGVYATKVQPNNAADANSAATIRIPSIADDALKEAPTTESPAIIVGSARQLDANGNEVEKLGRARSFEEPSADRVAPYSKFKYTVTEQQATDGSMVKKLTGFDGTYYIVRMDMSELWNSVPEEERDETYLHVSQDKNNALLVLVGMDKNDAYANAGGRDQWGNYSFSNLFTVDSSNGTAYQKKTGAYKLSEMYDAAGKDTKTPYFDVIVFSTAGIVAGADAQKENALNGDIELSFYMDKTADYDPSVNWDPQSTDTTLSAKCHAKFYNEEKAKEANPDLQVSRYKVKGSELHLETMVDNSDATGSKTTYWAFEKSFEDPYYDQEIDKSKTDKGYGRAIKLMSEVPVVNDLRLEGASADSLKKRTLDVSSFDIQVANNTSSGDGVYTSGLAVKNAWLKITDSNPTTGAELAIGNNATMTIDDGGKLYIDEKCQLEIEWDGATAQQTAGKPAPSKTDILNNGTLDLRKGGEIVNDGVITIEGTEGKPYQPGQEQQASASEKGHGELTICEGATLTNNGSFVPNGALYVQGKLINNGKYADYIELNDPDRGKFKYHKGIQLSWKDDVTQQNVIYGGMYVGMDKTWTKTYPNAVVTNNGDIVICPGELVNQAKIENKSNGGIYLCATDRAIVPIEPDPATPTITTKEVDLDEPVGSRVMNWGTIHNLGEMRPAQVTVDANGSLNKLIVPGNYQELFNVSCWKGKDNNQGKISGTGYLYKTAIKDGNFDIRMGEQTVKSVVYDGTAQPVEAVPLYDDLAIGTNDYTVSFTDVEGEPITADKLTAVGTYKVKIRGKNAYKGAITKEFKITPAEITELELSSFEAAYNGKNQKPTVKSVKSGTTTLAKTDYTVKYSAKTMKEKGTYKVSVTGKGNFKGTKTVEFHIV